MRCKTCDGAGEIVIRRDRPTHLDPADVTKTDCPAGCVFCEECEQNVDKLVPFEVDPWGGIHSYACFDCVDNYEPGDRHLSDYYGGGGTTQAYECEKAAAEKRRLG